MSFVNCVKRLEASHVVYSEKKKEKSEKKKEKKEKEIEIRNSKSKRGGAFNLRH